MRKRIVIVVGTRPEAIKLIPLYTSLKKSNFDVFLCATYQHDAMLDQVLRLFDVAPDIKLNIMKSNQDLFYLTTILLDKMQCAYAEIKPDLVIVQGDTTTAFVSTLAAFYLKISVAHVEAGLRTNDIYSPFPEEMNRRVISLMAAYHFAPTALNVGTLLGEGVDRNRIFCTGNTVVDALFLIKNMIMQGKVPLDPSIQEKVEMCQKNGRKIVVLTAHRRESFGSGLEQIFNGIKKFAQKYQDVAIFYPVHPNPHVLSAVNSSGLNSFSNIYLSNPLSYATLIFLLVSAHLVVTDSGGIQEEAVSLGKYVLVLRDKSERVECFWEGCGKLVGTNEHVLFENLCDFFSHNNYEERKKLVFGDGTAVERIVTILKTIFEEQQHCLPVDDQRREATV